MPPDNEEVAPEVREAPAEARGDSTLAEVARDGQEKPKELEEKEQAHERLRRKYKTASSGPLPRIDFEEEKPAPKAETQSARPAEVKAAEKPVDKIAMEKAAEGIFEAADGLGTDPDTINAILKDKTEAERKEIDAFYQQKYGTSLEEEFRDEMEGAELDQSLNLLNRKDGSSDDAGRIHTALIERDQWIEGRSDETCEKDIRDTLATMNSDQIAQLDREYKERYGKSLEDALLGDDNLAAGTKEAISVYLKGADKRTDEDTLQLADIALSSRDVGMMQEAFRNSTPEARQRFFTEGGEDKINLTFFMEPDQLRQAMDYARSGELSVTTLVNENQSWAGDNELAIENALSRMKDSELADYLKGKELATSGADPESLSVTEKNARGFYNKLHDSLVDAGNESEIARWEDMIERKGGSLVSKLMEHRGTIYDDSAGDVIKTIENMSKEDWKRLTGPESAEYRKEIEDGLKTYLDDDEVRRCMEIVDKKVAAGSFEEASTSGRRPILDALGDSAGVFNDDESQVYDAISKMTPAEQEQYRTDEAFRKSVDEKVAGILDEGAELDASRAMLDKVLKGEAPTEDIVAKLNRHAAELSTDEAAAIRDVVKEFRDHPEVREKIVHPQTAEEKEYAERFMKALHGALDDTDLQKSLNPLHEATNTNDFERYAKPLLETGHLSLDLQMELNAGVFNDDEQGFYKDVLALAEGKDDWSREERGRILNDGAYREKVLGALSEDERKVAVYALDQGEMRPEDKIRSHVLGAGTGEDEIKEVLAKLSPAEKETVKSEYARKYGEDLTYSLLDEMGGQDAVDARRAIRREHEDSRSAYNDTRDEYYESRDGFGSAWVDKYWDATGFQADEAHSAFSKAMTEHAAKFEELPLEQRQQLMHNLQENLDMFKESKGALADGLTDAGIAVGCVAAGFFTKGSTWVLLGSLVAGGFFKAGAKGAIMGADYDWNSSAAVADFAAGGADAALNLVTFGAGSTAAKAVLKEGGKTLIKEGAEETLEKGLVGIVRESIKDGTYKVSDDAVKDLVDKLAKEGADKQALEGIVRENLDVAVKEEAEGTIKKLAREYIVNLEAGVVGGGGSGTVRALAQWDTEKSFGENMTAVGKMAAMSAAFGAGGAVAATSVFKVGGKAFHSVQEHYHLQQGERLSQQQLDDLASQTGAKDASARYNENGDIEVTSKVETSPTKADDAAPVAGDQPELKRVADESSSIRPDSTDAPELPDPAWAEKGVYKLDDGTEVKMVAKGGFHFPKESARVAPDDGIKVHVLTSGTKDLEQLQAILIKELQTDKELAELAARWKTIDPNDPPAAGAIGDGQNSKAFTLAAKSPEDAIKLAAKLDEILAKHPEFKPISPEGLDTITGTSGRVGIVRDFYPAAADASGNVGARLDKALADRMHADPALERDAAGRLTDKALRDVETRTGLKPDSLAYDTNGNLMLRAADKPIDMLDKVQTIVGEPKDSGRFSAEQLEALAKRFKQPEGTYYYSDAGELMQKMTPSPDGKVYLTELDGGIPRGEVDPQTGRVSDGLQDRFAFYRLAEEYGVNPTDEVLSKPGGTVRAEAKEAAVSGPGGESAAVRPADIADFRAGETVKVNGKDVTVIGRDGESVVVRPLDAPPPDGPAVRVSDQELAANYTRLGGSGYYMDGNGIYELRTSPGGKKELVADFDADSVKAGNVAKIAEPASIDVKGHSGPRSVDLADQPTFVDGEPLSSTSEDFVVDRPATADRSGATISDGTLKPPAELPADTPPIVREFLERAGTRPEDQGALLARIQENNLAQTEALDNFSQRAADITSRWDDLSPLGVHADASVKELQDSYARYRELLLAKAPDGASEKALLAMHPDEARRFLQGDAEALQALDDYVRIRDINGKIQAARNEAVNERVGEVQALFDDLADKNNLPRVKIVAGDEVDMGTANGAYHDGRLTLRESDFLGNKDPLTFIEAAYHEFVHNQQDSLIVRSLVDEVERDVGFKLRPEHLDRVQELRSKEAGGLTSAEQKELVDLGMAVQDVRKSYSERAGSGISDGRLREVLRARNGERLTPDEAARAADLAQAWKESAPAGEAFAKAGTDLKVTNGELRKLSEPGGDVRLIERLAEDKGTLSRHIFNTDAPPAEVTALIDLYRRMRAGEEVNWPPDSRSVLKGLLENQQESLVQRRTELFKKYLSGFHEQEAWVIGSTLRAGAGESGITGLPPVAGRPGDTIPGMPAERPPQDTTSGVGDNFVGDTAGTGRRILSIDDSTPTSPGEPELRITGREDLGTEQLDKLAKMSGDHVLAKEFPPPTSAELAEMRKALEVELRSEVPVMGTDGVPTNMLEKLDKLVDSEMLGAGQRTRILNILAEVRTALKRIDDAVPEGSAAKGYQDVNWKHTRAEIDQVIDASIKRGLDAHEMENAIIASIFSDAAKFPKTPNTPGNFLVHNIDGAQVAAEVLPRYFDMSAPHNMTRLDHIHNAIREHQIGPPEFMASIMRNSLKGVLGRSITDEQSALVETISQKIAKPMDAPHVTDTDGVSRIDFTDAERELLAKVGVRDWYVPNPDSPWYGTSRAVIDGDSLINYASPDGWGKIAAIRGPETAPWFEDPTIFESLASAKKSYDDASNVISPEAKPLAEAGLDRTTTAVERVKTDMNGWFKQLEADAVAAGIDPATAVPRNADGSIAFWDAPLKYPTKGELTPLEKAQFDFAKQIRSEMVRRLREMQGVFDQPAVAK